MPAPAGKVPVLESARAGITFVGAEWRALLRPMFGGAGALFLAAALLPTAALPAVLVFFVGVTAAYGAFLRQALGVATGGLQAFGVDVGRLLGSAAIVGFFVLLLMLVAGMAGGVALMTQLAPYEAQLAQVQGDLAATNTILMGAYEENPTPFLILTALYVLVFYAVTSRLYLTAPATIADKRVRTFETWPWTKGSLLRIAAARFVLLVPLNFLAMMIAQLGGPIAAAAGPAAPFAAFAFLMILTLMLMALLAAEAGLSAFLYRGLKPAA